MTRPCCNLRLEIESRVSGLPLVSAIVAAFCQQHGLDDEHCFAVDLCVTEAVTNSITHAYMGEPDHHVVLELRWCDGAIEIEVEDEGIAIDDQTCERHLTLEPEHVSRFVPGGRGLFLMRQIMDQVVFSLNRNGSGNIVRMKLETPTAEPTGSETTPSEGALPVETGSETSQRS